VRILFWNVGGRELASTIAEAAHQENADIVCLAESREPVARLSAALNSGDGQNYLVPSASLPVLHRQLRVFARLPSGTLRPIRDEKGISVKRVVPPIGLDFTLVAVHLRSKLHQDPGDQTFPAVRLRDLIEAEEDRIGHRRTVIVGDLNMDPFERGVIAADGLHAVMTRSVAMNGHRIVDAQERHFFYNPMWNHFGDRSPSPPGTYYRRSGGQTVYFWHMFDQVLLRAELLPYLQDDNVRVLTAIIVADTRWNTGSRDVL
jgi:hypothetical protein